MKIWIPGVPQPKGSTRSFVVNGKAITTSAAKGLKSWEMTIRYALVNADVQLMRGPVSVEMHFYMPRPKSKEPKPRSADIWKQHPVPDVKPDLSKLIRAAEDPLNALLWEDDARVLDIKASKRYTNNQPGVLIEVTEAQPDEVSSVLAPTV